MKTKIKTKLTLISFMILMCATVNGQSTITIKDTFTTVSCSENSGMLTNSAKLLSSEELTKLLSSEELKNLTKLLSSEKLKICLHIIIGISLLCLYFIYVKIQQLSLITHLENELEMNIRPHIKSSGRYSLRTWVYLFTINLILNIIIYIIIILQHHAAKIMEYYKI